jgi:hypothetical protein
MEVQKRVSEYVHEHLGGQSFKDKQSFSAALENEMIASRRAYLDGLLRTTNRGDEGPCPIPPENRRQYLERISLKPKILDRENILPRARKAAEWICNSNGFADLVRR